MIESFNEMPLRVYEEILKLKDKELDAIDFEIELLALLTDMPVHDILDLPINEYRGYLNKAQFISNMPEVEGKCNMDNININGKEYFIVKDLNKIITAQYIDFQSYLKMDNATAHILSCFIIPKGKTYGKGYNINDVIKDIYELDVVTCMEICFFFIQLYQASILSILLYLDKMMKKMIRQEKDKEKKKMLKEKRQQILSIANGVGFTQLRK